MRGHDMLIRRLILLGVVALAFTTPVASADESASDQRDERAVSPDPGIRTESGGPPDPGSGCRPMCFEE